MLCKYLYTVGLFQSFGTIFQHLLKININGAELKAQLFINSCVQIFRFLPFVRDTLLFNVSASQPETSLTVVASVVAVFSMKMPPQGAGNRKQPADKKPATAGYTDPEDLFTLSGYF